MMLTFRRLLICFTGPWWICLTCWRKQSSYPLSLWYLLEPHPVATLRSSLRFVFFALNKLMSPLHSKLWCLAGHVCQPYGERNCRMWQRLVFGTGHLCAGWSLDCVHDIAPPYIFVCCQFLAVVFLSNIRDRHSLALPSNAIKLGLLCHAMPELGYDVLACHIHVTYIAYLATDCTTKAVHEKQCHAMTAIILLWLLARTCKLPVIGIEIHVRYFLDLNCWQTNLVCSKQLQFIYGCCIDSCSLHFQVTAFLSIVSPTSFVRFLWLHVAAVVAI